MTPESHQQVKSIFAEACGLEHGRRTAYLNQVCAQNADLRAEVEALLGHDDRPLDSLRTPVLGAALTRTMARGLSGPVPVPERIGPFRILDVLGEGGMGVVYRAEQDRPRRIVALKVVRPGLGTAGLVRRFEREAEVLGRLHHPGIAEIYQAGVHEAGQVLQPYFAMELVRGRPLTEHAAAHKLGVRERLALMIKVCDAVQHAHQRGVIHRDLKPGNILVEEGAETGQRDKETEGQSGEARSPAGPLSLRPSVPLSLPKILDFGIARVIDADLNMATLDTAAGQLVGTLPYMSPEQVQGDAAEIDTRTDVYALGVVLFELLAGRLPHELKGRSIPEAARIIRDEEPARLGALDRTLRGDLETIVSTAVQKDKARRYRSAADLGADLERFLNGEPIAARQDSALYVVRKRLGRYRRALIVSGVFSGALLAVGTDSVLQARANRILAAKEAVATKQAIASYEAADTERRRADDEAARAETALRASNIERGRLLGQTGNLSSAEDLIWPEALREPGSRHARWALWELYRQHGCLASWTLPEASTSIAVSPDARLVASGSRGAVFRVWDLNTGDCFATLTAPRNGVAALAFSPDGSLLYGACGDGTVRVWDPRSERRIAIFRGHRGAVTGVAVSPSGATLASGGADGVILVRDAASGAVAATLRGHSGAVGAIAFSPDGRSLVSTGADRSVRLWTLATARCAAVMRGHTNAVQAVAFSPDGTVIASGSLDRTIRLWDPATGACTRTMAPHNGTIRSLAFTPDSRSLLAGGWWSTDVWDVDTGLRTRSFSGTILEIAVTAGGERLVTGSRDCIRVWELSEGGAFTLLPTSVGTLFRVAFSPDGRAVAVGGSRGTELWDVRTRSKTLAPDDLGQSVARLSFSPDGCTLVTVARDRTVRLWDVCTGACEATMMVYGSAATGAAFTPDGGTLITAAGSSLRFWDPAGQLLRTLDTTRALQEFALDRSGERVLTIERGSGLHIWEAATGRVLAELGPARRAYCVCFSPDGRTAAVGDWDWHVQIWDTVASRLRAVLPGHTQLVHAVTYSPDGSLLLSGSADGTIRLWDPSTNRHLATLDAHRGEVRGLAFSPDGRTLAATYADTGVGLWDLTYYHRHIEGNTSYQRDRLAAQYGEPAAPAAPEDAPGPAEVAVER
jgi:WD40 repeat protein/serine/threonine protein kinase